jgi:hypothetical protein
MHISSCNTGSHRLPVASTPRLPQRLNSLQHQGEAPPTLVVVLLPRAPGAIALVLALLH